MTAARLKVIQLLPALEGGGVERGTLECSAALVQAGHESVVVSAGGRLVNTLEQEGGTHVTWDLGKKSPLTLMQIGKFRRWLAEQQADILHVRSRMPAWIAYLAWRGMHATSRPHLVTTLHGLHSVSRYSAVMGKGERVIAVSETARQYLIDHFQVPAERITRIYRGISPSAFPLGHQPDAEWLSDWQQAYPQFENQFVICLPGRLTRLKGHEHLLRIVRQLKDEQIRVMALIVGGEDPKRKSYAEEIYQLGHSLGIVDQLIYTGARSDILNIYSISDLVLSLSTRPESFGRTVLEALSIGKPVIGYAHGGVGEILQTLYPEGQVENNQWQVVAERIKSRVNGQDTSQPKPNEAFLLENMTGQTLDLYQELVNS